MSVSPGHARILVKVEGQNPTGSMKDRMALSVVDRAAADGRLPPGGTLVEYTGGSTGTSLAFVCAARGFASTMVTSDALSREKRDHMRALGAEVVELESEDGRTVLSGGEPGAHKIEGVGPGFVPPILDPELVDGIQAVSTDDAMAMARRLAREEALFAGTSSGANVAAALRVAERLGPDATVVTLLCDSGLKYLSTDLYFAGLPGP